MIKHLFYRAVARLLAFVTPNPMRMSAAAYATLESIAKNYEKILELETDTRLASYNRQFSVDTRERALRDASAERTSAAREDLEIARYAAERLKETLN